MRIEYQGYRIIFIHMQFYTQFKIIIYDFTVVWMSKPIEHWTFWNHRTATNEVRPKAIILLVCWITRNDTWRVMQF